jgi:hypothetical protein
MERRAGDLDVLGGRHIGGSVDRGRKRPRGAHSRSERAANNSGDRGTGARRCGAGIAVTKLTPMGPKPSGELKLDWWPSESPGEEYADVQGRGDPLPRAQELATELI